MYDAFRRWPAGNRKKTMANVMKPPFWMDLDRQFVLCALYTKTRRLCLLCRQRKVTDSCAVGAVRGLSRVG